MRTRLVILLESKNHHLAMVLHIVLLNTLSLIICLHIAYLHLIKYMQTSYPLCLFLISYMKLLTTQSGKLSWLKKWMHYKRNDTLELVELLEGKKMVGCKCEKYLDGMVYEHYINSWFTYLQTSVLVITYDYIGVSKWYLWNGLID